MGRQPCCDKVGLKKGPWTPEEDKKLVNFILANGQCCWRAVPKLAGLLRCGKSCRLRWTNYLRPDLKRGLLSDYEEQIVIDLHAQLGNRWSKIASHLPGRTDNEIKNHWNTHIKKKLKKMGIDPLTHKPLFSTAGRIEQDLLKGVQLTDQSVMHETQQLSHHHQQQQTNPTSSTSPKTMNGEIPETVPLQVLPIGAEEHKEEADGTTLGTRLSSMDQLMNISDEFCTDELVPTIEPSENLFPHAPTASSSISLASSSSASSLSCDSSKVFEEYVKFPDLGDVGSNCNNTDNNDGSTWDNEFRRLWDFLINDDGGEENDANLLLGQCAGESVDKLSWTCGKF